MATLMSRLKLRLIRGAREEDGTATIPFLLFLPFFMMLVISSLEMGMLMLRHVMLERGLDMAVRDLRLGIFKGDYDEFKGLVCKNAAFLPDCKNAIVIELQPVSTTTWAPLNSAAICVDRNQPLKPLNNPFITGAGDQLMLVRACAIFDPIVPTTGLGLHLPKDASGGYWLVTSSAFVNEPEPGT